MLSLNSTLCKCRCISHIQFAVIFVLMTPNTGESTRKQLASGLGNESPAFSPRNVVRARVSLALESLNKHLTTNNCLHVYRTKPCVKYILMRHYERACTRLDRDRIERRWCRKHAHTYTHKVEGFLFEINIIAYRRAAPTCKQIIK